MKTIVITDNLGRKISIRVPEGLVPYALSKINNCVSSTGKLSNYTGGEVVGDIGQILDRNGDATIISTSELAYRNATLNLV